MRWASAGSRSTICRSSRSITRASSTARVERLRGKVRYTPIGFELLPPRFSLTQLQRLYEMILGTELDKRNFRKKILAMDLLVETDEVEQGVRHRAARLYRFDRRKYDRSDQAGFRVRDVSSHNARADPRRSPVRLHARRRARGRARRRHDRGRESR